MNTDKIYTGYIVKDEEDGSILQFPDEMVNELSWNEGDTLSIEIEGDVIVIRNLTKKFD